MPIAIHENHASRIVYQSTAHECGVTWSTLNRFVQEHLNDKPPKPLTKKPKKHGHPTILEKRWFEKNKD